MPSDRLLLLLVLLPGFLLPYADFIITTVEKLVVGFYWKIVASKAYTE